MQTSEPFPSNTRFTIQRHLGAGGFGVVYEAEDHERGTRIALKTLHHLDANTLYAFKREFRALCDVVHPNLINLHELIFEDEQWFFTMDLIEGTDFFSYVCSSPALGAATFLAPSRNIEPKLPARNDDGVEQVAVDPERWIRLRDALRQLSDGLCALHAMGKLHRDLKPSNVLVTAAGKVVILDFGIVMDMSADTDHHTFENMVGTPAYMAVQQALGEQASPADDWYSVGVMLYEALTGRLPFEGTALQVLTRKQREDPPLPRTIAANVPADLEKLCMQLLRRVPCERPSGPDVLKRLTALPNNHTFEIGVDREASSVVSRRVPIVDNVPFVGREKHLAALSNAFERVRGGRATVVHVCGASGMGKSALARHFLDRLAIRDEVIILRGRCYEREAVPYKAVDNLIDSLSRYLLRLPEHRAAELLPRDVHSLVRLFPVLGRVHAVLSAPRRDTPPPDVQELRRRAFTALRELLGRMTDRKPVIVYIDDLQWGDADSVPLLGELLREPDAPSLLLLIGYRSEDADKSDMLRNLPAAVFGISGQGSDHDPGNGAVRVLLVGALNEEESHSLARSVLGDAATTERCNAIVQEADGSPFFLRELALTVQGLESGTSEKLRLETVLRDRLSHLPTEAQHLLEIVAVAGKPITRRVVREAATLTPEHEQRALGLLRAEHILRSRGAGTDEELETFHDRIRETAVARLEPDELVLRHLELANALEASKTAEPDMLALHYRRARRPEKATPYAILAGDRALEALAFDRAAELFAYALETSSGDRAKERALRIKLADALKNAGRGAEAAKEYSAAADGAPADEGLDLRRRAAERLLMSGYMDDGRLALRDVLRSVGITLLERRWKVLLSLLFWRLVIAIRLRKLPVRTIVPASTDALARLNLFWSATVGLTMTDFVQGAEFQARHLALALQVGDRHHIARGLALNAGYAGVDTKNRAKVDQAYQLAAGMADEIGDTYLVGLSRFGLAAIECLSGQWTRCLEVCQEAETAFAKCSGVAWELASLRIFALLSHFYRGDLQEMLHIALPLCADAKTRGDLHAETGFRISITYWAPLLDDQPEAARDEVRAAMAKRWPGCFDILNCYELLSLGRIDLYAGESVIARQRIKANWSKVARSLLLRLQMLRVFLYDLRASLALAVAVAVVDEDGDKKLLNSSLHEAEGEAHRLARENVAWALALSTARRAAITLLHGDARATLSLLDSAALQFDACDMALHAAAVRRRKGQIVGGDEGRALIESADAWMARQGITNPIRMTALFVPGFR